MSKEQLESVAWRVQCGELQILIWSHQLPCRGIPVELWTYLSQGMHKVGQPELVITLRRRDTEAHDAYSLEPLEWFKMVYSWGKKDRIIDPYHTHEAHFEHWLGSKNLEAVTYGMPMDLPGLAPALPPHRLHGIVLTKKEANIAKIFGYTRVIGHYGLGSQWFPFCPWIDRDRGECVTMEQMKGGMRGKEVPMKKIRAVSARWQGDRIILTIPLGREAEVSAAVKQTKPEQAWGFDSALDPDAGSCFYWEHGQTQMRVYGGPDQEQVQYCKGLAFLLFCPQQPKENWNLLEDGVTLFLRDPTWLSIRDALTTQRDLEIPLSGKMTFHIEFIRDTFSDDPTGISLRTPSGEVRSWHPRNDNWLHKSHLKFEKIIVPARLGPTASSKANVAKYIELIGETLAANIPKTDPGFGKKIIMAAFQLPNDGIKNWFTLSFSPGPEGLDGAGLVQKMLVLPRPDVNEYTSLNVLFSIWG